jgi:hypothetical protein
VWPLVGSGNSFHPVILKTRDCKKCNIDHSKTHFTLTATLRGVTPDPTSALAQTLARLPELIEGSVTRFLRLNAESKATLPESLMAVVRVQMRHQPEARLCVTAATVKGTSHKILQNGRGSDEPVARPPVTSTAVFFTCWSSTLAPFRPYRYSASERNMISTLVQEMVDAGVAAPSHSPWSSPVVLVRKKNGEHRFCVDYRRLNATTKRRLSAPEWTNRMTE